MERKAVCFVDDDLEELERFDRFMKDYIVGAGTTLNEALAKLEAQRVKKPDLFLLDLYYGPHAHHGSAEISRLDDQIAALETRMRALLAQAGQSPEEGFALAEEVHKRFPGIPRVLFSRKAFLKDALRAQEEGLPLLEKPDPTPEDAGATDKARKDSAFKRHAQWIKAFLDRRINLNPSQDSEKHVEDLSGQNGAPIPPEIGVARIVRSQTIWVAIITAVVSISSTVIVQRATSQKPAGAESATNGAKADPWYTQNVKSYFSASGTEPYKWTGYRQDAHELASLVVNFLNSVQPKSIGYTDATSFYDAMDNAADTVHDRAKLVSTSGETMENFNWKVYSAPYLFKLELKELRNAHKNGELTSGDKIDAFKKEFQTWLKCESGEQFDDFPEIQCPR